MATKLTTPIQLNTITYYTGDHFEIRLKRKENLVVDREESGMRYVMNKRDASGNIIETHVETLALADWPPTLRTKLKELRDILEAGAKQKGILPDGIKTEDLD